MGEMGKEGERMGERAIEGGRDGGEESGAERGYNCRVGGSGHKRSPEASFKWSWPCCDVCRP